MHGSRLKHQLLKEASVNYTENPNNIIMKVATV